MTYQKVLFCLIMCQFVTVVAAERADARIIIRARKAEVANQLVRAERVVNVRTGPSTKDAIVTRTKSGMTLEVLERVDRAKFAWFKVGVPGGAELGFLRGDLVTAITPAELQKPAQEAKRSCVACPEMVDVPAGSFTLGASASTNAPAEETPARRVRIDRPFRISKTEITVGQFQAYLKDAGVKMTGMKGCFVYNGRLTRNEHANFRAMPEPTSDNDPVACVSWRDAAAFAKWLADTTGRRFRLPSEAEWEYAARAGTKSIFTIDVFKPCAAANFADKTHLTRFNKRGGQTLCNDGAVMLSAVGRLEPNAFELHDTIGNVREWVADCWNPSHLGASPDGAARTSGNCETRVVRGPAWTDERVNLRVTFREARPVDARLATVGFRIVEDIAQQTMAEAN